MGRVSGQASSHGTSVVDGSLIEKYIVDSTVDTERSIFQLSDEPWPGRAKLEVHMRRKRKPKASSPSDLSPPHVDHSEEPYRDFPNPTPDQCKVVRDDLLAFHGFPTQFADYQRRRAKKIQRQEENHNEEELQQEETVLDGLISTLLSQNTTDSNSGRAFLSLKLAFPRWEDVLEAENGSLENAIRCGGLARTKAARIKNLLKELLERRGDLSLEYLRRMPVGEVKYELSRFKGIGPKTVACVLMFNLQQDDFPVDTHVLRITKSMNWVPAKADREKAYLHLNRRIPDELKFDLNCLIFTHGKVCKRCAKRASNQLPGAPHVPCPLVRYG